MKKKALILTDGKPGHENQSAALCRRLGTDYVTVRVSYPSRTAKALSFLLDRFGIHTGRIFRISETGGLPDASFLFIVSAGSSTFYPNKTLARKLAVPNMAVLNPKGYVPDFTAVLCPAYDRPPKRKNFIELPINLCAADPAFFEEQAAEFIRRHKPEKPAAGFIIGGPNAVSFIDPDDMRNRLESAFRLTDGFERWVTTSRRTPKEIEALIESFPFDFRLISSRDPYNPVPAFIRLCDRLFVTGDSASMISECASFGSAPVEILMNRQKKTPNKFEVLIRDLERRSAVHVFDGTLGHADSKIDLTALLKEKLLPLLDGVSLSEKSSA